MPRLQTGSQIIQTGLNLTTGDVILYRKEDANVTLHDIPKLWQQIGRHDIVISRTPARAVLGTIPRPAKGMETGKARSDASLQLVRRRALEGWKVAAGQESMIDCLIRKAYRWTEIDVRTEARVAKKTPASLDALRALAEARIRSNRLDAARSETDGRTEPARPNYLARLKAFALGE